jgi:hypothetical protein
MSNCTVLIAKMPAELRSEMHLLAEHSQTSKTSATKDVSRTQIKDLGVQQADVHSDEYIRGFSASARLCAAVLQWCALAVLSN